MARPPELASIRSSMRMVEQSIMGLRDRYGDTRAIRRLAEDVQRVFDDLDELTALHDSRTPSPHPSRAPGVRPRDLA